MVSSKILEKYSAKLISFTKDSVLFHEGDIASHYYQIEEGKLKMVSMSLDGQEFIQGIFEKGESFGEPAILGNFPYPSSGICLTEVKVWKLSKEQFLDLLKDNYDIHMMFVSMICKRLEHKSKLLLEVSFHKPDHRIFSTINYLMEKDCNMESHFIEISEKKYYQVPITRQQLADMTGLRVETVIRTVRKMCDDGLLSLIDHKICIRRKD